MEDDEEINKDRKNKEIKIKAYSNSDIKNGIIINDIKNEINYLYYYIIEFEEKRIIVFAKLI